MKLRVLCIDDSKGVQTYLRECLVHYTATFEVASDGRKGVEVFRQSPLPVFDLVFLDWEMPEMNGPEVLENLRKMGVKVPVIMLTTRNSPEDLMKALRLGANEYVMKPFTQDIIVEKIKMVLPGVELGG